MNTKQGKTLRKVFESPTRPDVKWSDIVSLFNALGAHKFEGSGSRVTFVLDSGKIDLHKPHPQKELKKYSIESIRVFLESINIFPE